MNSNRSLPKNPRIILDPNSKALNGSIELTRNDGDFRIIDAFSRNTLTKLFMSNAALNDQKIGFEKLKIKGHPVDPRTFSGNELMILYSILCKVAQEYRHATDDKDKAKMLWLGDQIGREIGIQDWQKLDPPNLS